MKASRSGLIPLFGVLVLGWAVSGCGSADRAMREESPGAKGKATATAAAPSPDAGATPPQAPTPPESAANPSDVTTVPAEPPIPAPSAATSMASGSTAPKSIAPPLLVGPERPTAIPKLQAKTAPVEKAASEPAVRTFSQPGRQARASAAPRMAASTAAAPAPMKMAPATREPTKTAPSMTSGMLATVPAPAPARAAADPVEAAPSPVGADTPEEPVVALKSMNQPAAAGAEAKDYTVVKVFYGTDRAAVNLGSPHPLGAVPWGYLTAGAGSVALVFLVFFCFFSRSRLVVAATGLAVLATAALGTAMVNIPRNTKPTEAKTDLAYGNDRGDLHWGTCEVSIPKDHEVGELESPSIFKLEFNEAPTQHVVLLGIEREEADAFYAELKDRVAQDSRKEAFVFVHGYSVTFEKAARRTAQLAHDLKFDGAPIFYSWPSQGGLLDYAVDETNVVWTVPHLKEFLTGVATRSGATRIHLIAHSMGNRALTSALTNLSYEQKGGSAPMFHEVVLTAPDIDADVFRRDIVPAITKTAQRVTLYASSNDEALIASKKIHGYPRAGESGPDIIVVPGIDTIDVSALDTSLLGHSYYGDNGTVLTDLAQLLHEEKPPSLRSRLKAMALGRLQYWVFLAEAVGLRPDSSPR